MTTNEPYNDEEWNTYEDWKDLGYHVIKGSKSTRTDEEGNALFNSDQVEEDPDAYDSFDELDFSK